MITKENIKEYVNYRILVVSEEKLQYIDSVVSRGSSGSSGSSGFSGGSGLLGLKSIPLIEYKEFKIQEVSEDIEFIRVYSTSEYYSNNNNYGKWYKTDNFLEAYKIIKILPKI
jgi:hypothetical protein